MKKIKFPFKNHFYHNFIFYVIAAILSPSLISYLIILKTNPKDGEIFNIFIEANLADKQGLNDFVREHTSGVKELNIYSSLSSLNVYTAVYATQGLESDILILSESAFKESDCSNYLEIESSSKYFNATNKIFNDKHFGIEIFNGESGCLTSFLSYGNERYYAAINKNTFNGELFSKNEVNNIDLLMEAILNG